MRRVLGSAFAQTTLGGLPVFLIGALAVQIRAELGFEPAGLGVLFLVFFSVSGLASIPAGHFIERLGPTRSSWLGVLLSVCVILVTAVAARSFEHLLVIVAIAAIGNAICQLSANLNIALAVPDESRGVAFGIKQAAVPAASLLGGLAVPAVALTVGWRWAFVFSSGMALFVRPAAGEQASRSVSLRSPRQRATDGRLPLLMLLSGAVLLGSAAGNSLTGFFVESSVGSGVGAGAAGLMLAMGSAAAILVRVLLGWRVDRQAHGHPLRLAGLLLLGGGGAYAMMAVVDSAVGIGASVVLCFGLGLGWNGLLVHAVVRDHPDQPAFASGVIQAGVYAGGALGPLLFGVLAERATYAAGWWMTALAAAIGGVLTLMASAGRERSTDPRRTPGRQSRSHDTAIDTTARGTGPC